MSTLDPDLLAAYRSTDYVIDPDKQPLVFHVGQPAPEVAALLQRHGVNSGALLTAFNPWSKPQTPNVNQLAQAQLLASVRQPGS